MRAESERCAWFSERPNLVTGQNILHLDNSYHVDIQGIQRVSRFPAVRFS